MLFGWKKRGENLVELGIFHSNPQNEIGERNVGAFGHLNQYTYLPLAQST
jgi:hypothetical protein